MHASQQWKQCNAWFPPFRCRSAVAVSPLLLRKFRKNYVCAGAVRITLLTWKIPLRGCRFHLPLRCNCRSVTIGSNPTFCRSAVGVQPISVLVTSSLCIRKTFPAFPFSPATATVLRHGTTERRNRNGMVETRHNERCRRRVARSWPVEAVSAVSRSRQPATSGHSCTLASMG